MSAEEKANMVRMRLLVERGSLQDQSEEWGELDFLALPSPGDRLSVRRGNEANYLTVLCVHHQPTAPGDGEEPTAYVVAKWTGAG
ncbi:MAG: hypothetical protein ACT4N8_07065 [Sphingosinicella sp.]|uniref:hypothetical protein n=1 Tax=Sphingosinicella sp. TaxID=1917971 RepID=UPI00403800F2